MYEGFWKDFLLNNLYIPVLLAFLGIIIKIAQQYADKFVDLFNKRQKIESMEKIASVRDKLVTELDKNVQAAVASNIDMADKMKAAGHKLDEGQIREINESAKLIIMKSLPADINGMTPADILGGDHVMNAMIDSLMEKHVLEYKIKRAAAKGETVQIVEDTSINMITDDMSESEDEEVYHDEPPVYNMGEPEPVQESVPEVYNGAEFEDLPYQEQPAAQEDITPEYVEQQTDDRIVIEKPIFTNGVFDGVG